MSSTVSHPHAPRRSPSLAALLNPSTTNTPPFFRRASSPRHEDQPPPRPALATRHHAHNHAGEHAHLPDGQTSPVQSLRRGRQHDELPPLYSPPHAPPELDRQRESPGLATSPTHASYARKRPRTADSPLHHAALPPINHPRSPPGQPPVASVVYSSKMPPPERPASATLNGAGRASASPSFAHRPLPSPGLPAPPGQRRMSGGNPTNHGHAHVVSPITHANVGYNHHNVNPGSRSGPVPGVPSPGSPDDAHPPGGHGGAFGEQAWPKPGKPISRRTSTHPSSGASAQPSPPTLPNHVQPHAQSSMQPPARLEPSIFTVSPLDEFTVEVGEWLWEWLQEIWRRGEGHMVEIEAKIGLLIDNSQGKRMDWPVATETPLKDSTGIRFESSMTEAQHKRYNQILNKRVEESVVKGYQGALIKYSHRYEMDEFFPMQKGIKARVTRDSKTGMVKEGGVIIKERIADLNVYSPKRRFDYRVSISLERPTPLPQAKPTTRRYKDRISYEHQICQVDLTQVKSDTSSDDPRHELEVEFKSAHSLIQQAERYVKGLDNEYHEMIQVFLNNVRMLVRNAGQP